MVMGTVEVVLKVLMKVVVKVLMKVMGMVEVRLRSLRVE